MEKYCSATYDLNTDGSLILKASESERNAIRELMDDPRFGTSTRAESEVLEWLLANSELEYIAPEEIGALTDAPIMGIRNAEGEVTSAWGFMDYAVRSFLTDLVEDGRAVFIGGTVTT